MEEYINKIDDEGLKKGPFNVVTARKNVGRCADSPEDVQWENNRVRELAGQGKALPEIVSIVQREKAERKGQALTKETFNSLVVESLKRDLVGKTVTVQPTALIPMGGDGPTYTGAIENVTLDESNEQIEIHIDQLIYTLDEVI